jgi:serine/threonine-protein kinase
MHGCGILSGAPYCWGSNTFGQLGTGNTTSRSTPVLVPVDGQFEEMAAGVFNTCGVRTGGDTLCWGTNDFGELATGDFVPHLSPTTALDDSVWRDLTLQDDRGCAIHDGELYCWGSTSYGGLGTGEGLVPAPVENGL